MKKLLVIGLASMMLAACGNDNSNSDSSSSQALEENSESTQPAIATSETAEQENKLSESLVDVSDKREAAFTAIDHFLEVELNFDTKDSADYDDRQKRREELASHVTDEVLKQLEPTDEELKEQGFPIPNAEKEYDPTVSPVTNLMEYEYELDNRNIYIDEESLNTKTIHALADAFYIFETDMEGQVDEFDQFRAYTFNIENKDGSWVISEFEVIRDERLKSEDERQG